MVNYSVGSSFISTLSTSVRRCGAALASVRRTAAPNTNAQPRSSRATADLVARRLAPRGATSRAFRGAVPGLSVALPHQGDFGANRCYSSASTGGATIPPRSSTRPPAMPPTTLKGKFVTLRPLLPDDALEIFNVARIGRTESGEFSEEDGGLFRYFPFVARTEEDMHAFVGTSLQHQLDGVELPFVIIDSKTKEVMGATRFANISVKDRRLDIGWTIVGQPWQGTVVHSEAMLLALTHAFEQHGVTRVGFHVDRQNKKARAALDKLGAEFEGVLRSAEICWPDGRLRDNAVYSIMPAEWHEDVKPRLLARVQAEVERLEGLNEG